MRAMMNQENQDEKLEQNEDLAKLRANTSIEKTILSKTLPSSKDMMGNVAIIRGKNETD
jgi:serine phosphatase RsbU (regulator of sigma subunit)